MPRGNSNDNERPEDLVRSVDFFPILPLFADLTKLSSKYASAFSSYSRGEWVPPVDISEQDDGFTLIADLPEMTREDLRVYTESATTLCLSGLRRHRETQSDRPLLVAERGVGRFQRCFDLPSKLDVANVKASFKDAQLVVTVPKLSKANDESSNSVTIE